MSLSFAASQDSVNRWMAEFAQAEGITGFQLDERGLIGLQVNSALDIEIEVPSEQGLVYLRAGLLPLPAQQREAVYARLLERNFLLQDCGGATFAIDADRAELALSLCQPIGKLDGLDFDNLLRGFIDMALHWQGQLTQELQASSAQQVASTPPWGR